ncbi:hypothetical protein J6590_018088 [Homalodisca vitripennis]|nr:hypothetical protein J6590_018088 [Homalodisca vitripennis]
MLMRKRKINQPSKKKERAIVEAMERERGCTLGNKTKKRLLSFSVRPQKPLACARVYLSDKKCNSHKLDMNLSYHSYGHRLSTNNEVVLTIKLSCYLTTLGSPKASKLYSAERRRRSAKKAKLGHRREESEKPLVVSASTSLSVFLPSPSPAEPSSAARIRNPSESLAAKVVAFKEPGRGHLADLALERFVRAERTVV